MHYYAFSPRGNVGGPAKGVNRFITIFFYLVDVNEGGETSFPMAGHPDSDEKVRLLRCIGRASVPSACHQSRPVAFGRSLCAAGFAPRARRLVPDQRDRLHRRFALA
jgi:hypothetical protein